MKYLALLLILVAISCKKPYNKNVVNVHAYNVLDGTGIDSVYVAVYKEPAGDLGKDKIVADGYTNSEGNLELIYSKFKLFKSFNLYDYYDDTYYKKIKMIINGTEWNGDGQTGAEKITNFEIQYVPMCNYKLHIINSNCFNANDTLMLSYDNMVTGETYEIMHYIIGVGFLDYSASGCFDEMNTVFIPTIAGNRRYYGYIKRDNGTAYFDTIVFFQPFQDNIIELFF